MVESERIVTTSSHRYALAGWLAIASAVLLVPEIGLSILLKFLGSGLEVLIAPLHVVNLAIGIFVLYMFRSLLNERYNFHGVDIPIMILICTNIVFFVLGLFDLFSGIIMGAAALQLGVSVLTMVLFVLFSIVNIAFGVMLLNLKDDLFGLLKPYAFTTITSGALGATVILAPLGLIAAVAALVILGMIFLRAKEEAEIL